MPHGTATGGITSFDLLEYCIGGCFKEAERRGYRGAELDQMRRLLLSQGRTSVTSSMSALLDGSTPTSIPMKNRSVSYPEGRNKVSGERQSEIRKFNIRHEIDKDQPAWDKDW